MQCHKCGHVNEAGKKYCPKCGASLAEFARIQAEQLELDKEQERLNLERHRKRHVWRKSLWGTNIRKMVTIACVIGMPLLLALIAVRFATQRAAEQLELTHCDELLANAAVSFRDLIPGARCKDDRPCIIADITKLQSHKLNVNQFPVPGSAMMRACVGFRADMGGTLEGAECIIKILGDAYTLSHPNRSQSETHFCQTDGFPYEVGVK